MKKVPESGSTADTAGILTPSNDHEDIDSPIPLTTDTAANGGHHKIHWP